MAERTKTLNLKLYSSGEVLSSKVLNETLMKIDDFAKDASEQLAATSTTALYDVENIFKYHSPKEGQPAKYEVLRNQAKITAALIIELCPESRERSLALTKLEESIMWANASIARNE